MTTLRILLEETNFKTTYRDRHSCTTATTTCELRRSHHSLMGFLRTVLVSQTPLRFPTKNPLRSDIGTPCWMRAVPEERIATKDSRRFKGICVWSSEVLLERNAEESEYQGCIAENGRHTRWTSAGCVRQVRGNVGRTGTFNGG